MSTANIIKRSQWVTASGIIAESCRFLRLAFVLILCYQPYCFGQSPGFRHFTVEDGLDSPTIYACLQDDKGYIWFTTESGVNRFNGRKFESFSMDEGLADNEIFSIYQDRFKRIWFLSFNGHLSYYRKGKFYNSGNTPFLKKAYTGQSILSMREDGKGRLWVNCYGNEIILIENEKVRKFRFEHASLLAGGVSIFITEKGEPEFRFERGIFRFDESKQSIVFYRNGKYEYLVQRASHSETDANFAVVKDGIVMMHEGKEQLIIQLPPGEMPFYYTSLYFEQNNILWAATIESGIEIYKVDKDTAILIDRYLPDLQISEIIKDREGNLWVGTKDEGVYMLSDFGRAQTIYSSSDKFPSQNVYTVHSDESGNIWSGGVQGFVTCIDSSGKITKNYQLAQAPNNNCRIMDIQHDHEGNIWLATSYKTHKIDRHGKESVVGATTKFFRGPQAGKSLTVDERGDVFIAFFGGVARFNRKLKAFDLIPGQGYPVRTFCVQACQKRLFVANINGLCEYINDSLQPLYLHDERLTYRISAMRGLNDSLMAIATNGNGIYIYSNDTIISHFTSESGLPSNDCRNLFVSGEMLWIVTDKGVVRYNFIEKSMVIDDLLKTVNGLYGKDIRDVTVLGNKIYVGTSRGLIALDQDLYRNIPIIPSVLFLSFEANKIQKSLDSAIVLKYFENHLNIHFEAVTHTNPFETEYSYKVGEGSQKWELTHSNEINLSLIPPGDYDLLIRTRIGKGLWSAPSVLHFTILKPFWETFAFRFALLLVLIALIALPFYLIYRRRIRNRWIELDKLQAVNRERQRISYDLHDDLGSSLTSISMNAEIIKQKQVRNINFKRELDGISSEANEANVKMSDIIWAISVSNDHLPGLASYINEFISDFEYRTGIKCSKKIEESLPAIPLRPEVRKNLFLAVKEAFHNIQKHSGAKTINFELFILDNILNISIRDDGVGIDKTAIMDSSVGLKSMETRLGSISGDFVILSEPGQGTEVILRYNLPEPVKNPKSHTKV